MKCMWRGLEARSTENLQLHHTGDEITARSTVITADFEYEYEITLSGQWVFRTLRLRCRPDRSLELERDAEGNWRVDAKPRALLVGAIDIDLAFSPFTNSLPIRRLNLKVGESAEIVAAYVHATTLALSLDPQRYTRLSADTYLYESRNSDFRSRITVDAEGLVLDYPGLFRRTR